MTNDKKRKVFIIGLGLIGGSLCKAIRLSHDVYITAYDVNSQALDAAKGLSIIDNIEPSIEAGAQDADLVLLPRGEELRDGALHLDGGRLPIEVDVLVGPQLAPERFHGPEECGSRPGAGDQLCQDHSFESVGGAPNVTSLLQFSKR